MSDIQRILVATISPMAAPVIAAVKARGLEAVSIFSTTTLDEGWVQSADYDVYVGDGEADGDLNLERVVGAALDAGCDAMIPLGPVACDVRLLQAAASANLALLGVDVRMFHGLADPVSRRALADQHGVPCVPTSDYVGELAMAEAAGMGLPLVVASEHGVASRRVSSLDDLEAAVGWIRASTPDSQGRVYLRRSVEGMRLLASLAVSDQHGVVSFVGLVDLSCRRGAQVEVVVMGEVLSEAATAEVQSGTERLLSECAAAGIHQLVWAVDAQENAYLLDYQGGLPLWHALVAQVAGVDLVDAVFKISVDEPLSWRSAAVEDGAGIYLRDGHRTFLGATRSAAIIKAQGGVGSSGSERLERLLRSPDFLAGEMTPMVAGEILS